MKMHVGESEGSLFQNTPHNLQEVLFVMGGRSLDDSDDEDEEEDGEINSRIHPKNCAFYCPKLRKHDCTSYTLFIILSTKTYFFFPIKYLFF